MRLISRLFLLLLILIVSFSGCEPETITTVPASVIDMPELPSHEPSAPITATYEENFEGGVDRWSGFAYEGAFFEITWNPEKKLAWTVRTEAQQAALITCPWPELKNADGLTIRLTSENRSAFLVMGVQEDDGSFYRSGTAA